MACNLRCVYCYEGAGIISNESLSDTTRHAILQFIKKQALHRKVEQVSICLFGGEPLLGFKKHVGFLEEVKSFCDEEALSFITTIVTNGTLVTQESLDLLVKFNCKQIQITLDGTKAFHDTRRVTINGGGSFDETVRGIKLIKQDSRLHNPVIRINIDKTNIDNVQALLEYLRDENLTSCTIDFGIVKSTTAACASYSGNCFLEEELGELLFPMWELVERLGFNAADQRPMQRSMFCGLYSDASFTIAPSGDLYKCWDHVTDAQHRIGKLDATGELVETTANYFKWMTRNPYYIDECRACVYLPTCGGGCAAISFSQTGDYNKDSGGRIVLASANW